MQIVWELLLQVVIKCFQFWAVFDWFWYIGASEQIKAKVWRKKIDFFFI